MSNLEIGNVLQILQDEKRTILEDSGSKIHLHTPFGNYSTIVIDETFDVSLLRSDGKSVVTPAGETYYIFPLEPSPDRLWHLLFSHVTKDSRLSVEDGELKVRCDPDMLKQMVATIEKQIGETNRTYKSLIDVFDQRVEVRKAERNRKQKEHLDMEERAKRALDELD